MDPARLPEGIPEQFLLDLYVRTGRETLTRMRDALRRWIQTGSEADLADARRMAHNLKGSSCQLGFDEVAHLAGALEMFFGALLRRRRAGDPDELKLIDAAVALAESSLGAVETSTPLPDFNGVTLRLQAEPR